MNMWAGGEDTHWLLALVISPLTTHPFRDGVGWGGGVLSLCVAVVV